MILHDGPACWRFDGRYVLEGCDVAQVRHVYRYARRRHKAHPMEAREQVLLAAVRAGATLRAVQQ